MEILEWTEVEGSTRRQRGRLLIMLPPCIRALHNQILSKSKFTNTDLDQIRWYLDLILG